MDKMKKGIHFNYTLGINEKPLKISINNLSFTNDSNMLKRVIDIKINQPLPLCSVDKFVKVSSTINMQIDSRTIFNFVY
jgi:hypothetical protein